MILGIDPAFRNTGLCLYGGTEPKFGLVKTDSAQDFASSTAHMRRELTEKFKKIAGHVDVISIERQISKGAESSAMQFAAQCLILELCLDILKPTTWVAPLVIQLRSYMKKNGVDIGSDGSKVRSFREQTGYKPRLAVHCVDAYYLCRAAEDVIAGRWQYKLPGKETALIPGVILNAARGETKS